MGFKVMRERVQFLKFSAEVNAWSVQFVKRSLKGCLAVCIIHSSWAIILSGEFLGGSLSL